MTTRAPTSCSAMSSTSSAGVGTSWSLTEVMTSPRRRPARAGRSVLPDPAHQRTAAAAIAPKRAPLAGVEVPQIAQADADVRMERRAPL